MDWNITKNKNLIQAFLVLATEQDAKAFLRDLMTEKEIEEFANRLQAAHMLMEKIPYTQIEKSTGLSSTTVARVSKWLNGPLGGYKKTFNQMHHHDTPHVPRGSS